jgi:conjugative transfer pilus assembly protein TraH
MIKKISVNLVTVLIFLVNNSSYASIEEDLKQFFNNVGMSSNINSSGSYKDQAAGYYTGGSLVARNAVRNAQFATVQTPGFRAGCGGIDAWTGGFSHIKAQELINMMRSIGSSAASYAFLLSIQTVSPQIYNIMNELNAIATKINHLNVNSCEAAATMLGGVWPKSDQSSKHLCQAMGVDLGGLSDWAAARQGCGAKGERDNIISAGRSNPKYKDVLVGEFNLSWNALQKNEFLSSDQALSELFMTLVGSIISTKSPETWVDKDGQVINSNYYETRILPGHSDKEDVLDGLLNGGKTSVYACDSSDKCLNPNLRITDIPAEHALRLKVHNTLNSLVDKIYEDTAISDEEKAFLNSTRLPVYKMLNVITAYRKGAAPVDVNQYGDLIALDILCKYVVDIIDLVHDSVTQLKSVQVDDTHVERFLKQLKTARERVIVRRSSAFQQMDNILSFIQSTQLIEKQLHVMLGGVANENNWF